MAKAKPAETLVEMVETTPKKAAQMPVEAKHTITYSQPIFVPLEDSATEDSEEDLIVDGTEEEEERKRPPSFRTKLREKLNRNGIAGTEQLRLRIDRLPLYDANGQSGINAEKEFIRTTTCTESFITGDEYLEHIRSIAGPGVYWLTLRHKNTIVQSWQERIGGAPQEPAVGTDAGVIAAGNTVDPSALMDGLMRQFEKFQKLQAAMMPPWIKQMNPADFMQSSAQPSQSATTESALLTLLNSEDDLVNAAVGKLRKLFRGDGSAAEEKGPWDAIVAALTSPTLPQVVSQLAQSFRTAAQPGAPNGQPQTPPPPPPDIAAYQIVISRLVEAMRLNGDAAGVIAAIDGFCTLFPQHQPQVEALLNAPPEQALQMLAQFYPPAVEAIQLPHAVEWVQQLRDAYFQSEPEPDGGE